MVGVGSFFHTLELYLVKDWSHVKEIKSKTRRMNTTSSEEKGNTGMQTVKKRKKSNNTTTQGDTRLINNSTLYYVTVSSIFKVSEKLNIARV